MEYLKKYLIKLKKEEETLEKKCRRTLNVIKDFVRELNELGGDIRTSSKEAMNDTINNDLRKAGEILNETRKKLEKFDKKLLRAKTCLGKLLQDSKLEMGDFQNSHLFITKLEKDFSAAKEEFFEAKILHLYIKSKKKKIPGPTELKLVDFESYAGALSDFCGELLRKSKWDIINDFHCEKKVKKYYNDIKIIYQALAKFAFSNKSGIRPKVDNLKGYIRGFENLLCELKMKTKNSNKPNKKSEN